MQYLKGPLKEPLKKVQALGGRGILDAFSCLFFFLRRDPFTSFQDHSVAPFIVTLALGTGMTFSFGSSRYSAKPKVKSVFIIRLP